MATRKSDIMTISINPDLGAAIRAQAVKERRTISAIVTLSLENYLESIAEEAPKPRARIVRPA